MVGKLLTGQAAFDVRFGNEVGVIHEGTQASPKLEVSIKEDSKCRFV